MSASVTLNGFTAATTILEWLRAYHGGILLPSIDLDLVRQMLPTTRFGKGVREIKPPMAATWAGCEGALVRNPNDPAEWGIFYRADVSPERQRFTIAHELGHFVLHRERQAQFNCDTESVHSGAGTLLPLEREADEFASNLLMPGDVLRGAISTQRIDLRLLSDLARRFEVSFEALCIRFIKYTDQRAILLYWDNGFLKYEWRSRAAIKTRARIRRTDDPQEPLPGTLAADDGVAQQWSGVELPASVWCAEEAPHMKLREFKHRYGERERALTLLLLESAEPRCWDRSWDDGETEDSYDRFISRGQYPVQ